MMDWQDSSQEPWRERWGDVEIPEGDCSITEFAIVVDHETIREREILLSDWLEEIRAGIEELLTAGGGKLLGGPVERDDGTYMFLIWYPIVPVLVLADMSDVGPPGTIPLDTIKALHGLYKSILPMFKPGTMLNQRWLRTKYPKHADRIMKSVKDYSSAFKSCLSDAKAKGKARATKMKLTKRK